MGKRWISAALKAVCIITLTVWSIGPIALVVLSSFKEAKNIFETPYKVVFWPTTENYRTLYETGPEFFRGLVNSGLISFGAITTTIVVTFLAGYVFARSRKATHNGIAFFMLFIRMLPPIVIVIPLYPVVSYLALNDTHILLVLLYSSFYVSLGAWIMRSFIREIPIELEESAAIDGASLFQMIRMIIIPLSKPGIITVALFVFVFAWNEYVFAMIFTTSGARTAPVVIAEWLSTAEGVQWGTIFAASTIQLVPVMLIVLCLQRYLVTGLTAGAVKG